MNGCKLFVFGPSARFCMIALVILAACDRNTTEDFRAQVPTLFLGYLCQERSPVSNLETRVLVTLLPYCVSVSYKHVKGNTVFTARM